MAAELFGKNFMNSVATFYQKMLGKQLNKMGLRYEDLMASEGGAAYEALMMADKDLLAGRYRRLKRASDLSYKGKELPDYAPNMKLEPFKLELWHEVEKVEKRMEEQLRLDYHKK